MESFDDFKARFVVPLCQVHLAQIVVISYKICGKSELTDYVS
jgi:hypothetical protein